MISTAQFKPERRFAGPAEHLIASIRGSLPGPTLIILGGIHGNEPAGVLAAERVWLRMQKRRAALHGEVVLLRGNTRALEQRVRYINADLNGNGRLRMFAPPSWSEVLLKCRNSSNSANCLR
jgi:succinylglutamate desuccinylase